MCPQSESWLVLPQTPMTNATTCTIRNMAIYPMLTLAFSKTESDDEELWAARDDVASSSSVPLPSGPSSLISDTPPFNGRSSTLVAAKHSRIEHEQIYMKSDIIHSDRDSTYNHRC